MTQPEDALTRRGVFWSGWSLASIAWAPTPTQALMAPIRAAHVILILGTDKDILPQAHEAAAISFHKQVNGGCVSSTQGLAGPPPQLPSHPSSKGFLHLPRAN